MDEARIRIRPNTVALSEVGSQNLGNLAKSLGELGNVAYEPDQPVIVIKENELTGAGAEYWEIVDVIIEGTVSGASTAFVVQVVEELKRFYSRNLKEHPRNHQNYQDKWVWEHRQVRIRRIKKSATSSDGKQIVEVEESVEFSSEGYLSKSQ